MSFDLVNFVKFKDIFEYFCTFIKHDKETFKTLRSVSRLLHEKIDYNLQNYYVFVDININLNNEEIEKGYITFTKPTNIPFGINEIIKFQITKTNIYGTYIPDQFDLLINNAMFLKHIYDRYIGFYLSDQDKKMCFEFSREGVTIPEFYKINRLIKMINKYFCTDKRRFNFPEVDIRIDKIKYYGENELQFWPRSIY